MARTAAQPQIVTALTGFVGVVEGTDIVVLPGDLFASDDPIVKKWSDLFGPAAVRRTGKAPAIEQATAAPGEKRGA